MTSDNGFEGVWIPAELWESREVTLQEKVMLIQIKSLAKKHPERGCFKRNEAFAEFFGLSKSRVSEVISALEKKGLIFVRFQRKGKQVVERNIYLTQAYHDMVQDKVIVPPEDETPFGNGDDPLRETLRTPSGLAEESNTLSSTVEDNQEREPALSNDNVATPEQLDTLFNQSSDTRRKFEMSFDWEPDRNMVCDRLRHTRVPVPPSDQLTNFICEFRNHFEAQAMRQTEHQWIAKLVQWIKRDNVNQSERPKSKQRQPDNFGQIDYRAGAEEMGFEVI